MEDKAKEGQERKPQENEERTKEERKRKELYGEGRKRNGYDAKRRKYKEEEENILKVREG
jgi:hypothetical protein